MRTRTTYTSTIKVPIYASWKCPHCGETNFSLGNIVCQRANSTTSWRTSAHEEAKNEASSRAQREWKQNALNIIFSPQDYPQNVRGDLVFQNTNCTKCGKKPKWSKGTMYLSISALSVAPAIISGIIAIGIRTSWVAWLIFSIFLCGIFYGFVSEKIYNKSLKKMPKCYLPVIGSLNEELIVAAGQRGMRLPSPDETILLVSNTKAIPAVTKSDNSHKVNERNNEKEQVCFCRKCGAKLPDESDFCNKCGTAVIH